MASLKELRNRIASVKATQKITRAMQMVAASKLRRAQAAAEAARPYSLRMNAVLANLATTFSGRDDAPALLSGTGKDDVAPAGRLHRRTRPLRRVQLVDRPPGARSCGPSHQRGQDGQDPLRRQEGL